jgi:prevent-host-death family protein
MTVTIVSSREFSQDVTRAMRAAERGPVFITDHGKAAHVLLSIADYRRLTGVFRSIVEALSMPGLSDIDIEVPRWRALPRPADRG